ncbi:MAG TPA: maleylpyruvate isomerase N-terminal domain-containing protein [Ktedonobacterales bacterium]|nr:maleylpyruvate isomerase N-terminal domain-containing protein [Ktedonobacterales bacterium]
MPHDNQPGDGASVGERMRAEHTRLEALLAGFRDEEIVQPGRFGAWSVKDMLAHITFWEQRLIAYVNGATESLVQPDEDETVAIDRINAEVLAAHRDRRLAEVRAAFDASYQQTLALAESLSAEDLANEALYGLLAGDTFEHYREHIEMLENGQR